VACSGLQALQEQRSLAAAAGQPPPPPCCHALPHTCRTPLCPADARAGAPEDLDISVYDAASPDAADIERGAQRLAEAAHAARQFTDTANFTLRCGVCQLGLRGEKEAVVHAKETGHTNFAEY
jgi:hypothetical protein